MENTATATTQPRRRGRLSVRMLCEGAIMVAIAMILSFLPLYKFPHGGSIDLAMIPVLFFAIRWGFGPGLLAGFVFGLLQIITEGAVAWGWQSILLDFLVAYTPLGLAGLFKGKKWGVFAGTVLGVFARFIVHFISGITIYAITVPTAVFNVTYTNPWMYSAAYNGAYLLPDMVLCLVVFALLYKPMKRFFLGSDIK